MPARLNTNLSHVAVIGGAGFLGRHIVQALRTFSNRTKITRISVLDLNLNPEQTPADYPIYNRNDEDNSDASGRTSIAGSESEPSIPITFHACDITSLPSLTALLDELRPDVVFHTASPHADAPHALLEKVNVQGTANVIEACRLARLGEQSGGDGDGSTGGKSPGARALVYTSSASVVFDARRKSPAGLVNADERWPVVMGKAQSEFYTDTKARAERLILAANKTPLSLPKNDKPNDEKENTLLTCALRPAGIFGEHDGQLLPNLLLALRRGQTRFQVGDNTNLFDFTYAGNVAWAHLLAAAGLLGSANAMNSGNKSSSEVANVDSNNKNTNKNKIEDDEEDKIIAGEAFFITNASPVPFYDFCRAIWYACAASDASTASTPRPTTTTTTTTTTHKPDPFSSSPIVIPTTLALFLATLAELVFRIFSFFLTGNSTTLKPNLTRQRIWFSTVTRYYSVEKARRRLGYEPVVGLQEGIRRGVEWVCWDEGLRARGKGKGKGEL